MRPGNAPWHAVTAAELEWASDGCPRSRRFGDIYFSGDDARAETRHVFLQGNGLPARWQQWHGGHFCIGETGFGTGLNFLLTWQAWLATPQPRPRLHYLSFEKYPLAPADLARALGQWPELEPLASELLQQYPGLLPGQHRLLLERGRITLDLWWEDVNDALPDLAGRSQRLVDAWYLDGFAPASNEAMWRPQVLTAVAALSRPGATFSTFTAAGQVRRELAGAGFNVYKVPGYGRKRECLRGELGAASPSPALAPPAWDRAADPGNTTPGHVIVLGAGLAGCTTAAALARRGVQVTLLERHRLAAAGSGNEQGILYTRLSPRHSSLVDFALQSFWFSSHYYRQLFASGALLTGCDGALCGSFHQQHHKTGELAGMAGRLAAVPELAQVLQPQDADDILGVAQECGGYWYPRSGWLRPPAVCRALSLHRNVELVENCGELTLAQTEAGWRAQNDSGRYWEAPCAVIATGTASGMQVGLDWLPLQSIRGQTTDLPQTPASAGLRSVLCHRGYIAPAVERRHCIGATFNLHDYEATLRAADHQENLSQLARAVPAWAGTLAGLDARSLAGRVGFRCASPDYLPLAGPVPDHAAFLRQYAVLRRNARHPITTAGSYIVGLYLTTGHGSRGLSSAPLAAELLASDICGEPPPLCRDLGRALAPARFIIRDLSRNRI